MKHILTYDDLIFESTPFEYRPLGKILSSQFTLDRKYIIVEGNAYSCETGELAAINEEWTWSEILHTGADVLSMGLDYVLPGTGAIVDILNTISYLIEAQFVAPEKRDQLYLMAGITFAFVILPGPLQMAATPIKRWIKNGAVLKSLSGPIKMALEFISSKIKFIIVEIPKWIKKALKSKLGNTLLGKFGTKIGKAVSAFSARLESIFSVLIGKVRSAKGAIKTAKTTTTTSIKAVAKGIALTALPTASVNLLKKAFAKKVAKKVAPELTEKALTKLGFITGHSYRYIDDLGKAQTLMVTGIKNGKVAISGVKGITAVPVETFVSRTIGAPWGRRGYSTAVPFFIKRYADMLDPNGELSEEQISKLAGLDPNTTSAESLAFLQAEVADYEGDTQNYNVDQNVIDAQTALSNLGYNLTIDGKFGPETSGVIKQFQDEHGLSSSAGKLDNATLIKLKELTQS